MKIEIIKTKAGNTFKTRGSMLSTMIRKGLSVSDYNIMGNKKDGFWAEKKLGEKIESTNKNDIEEKIEEKINKPLEAIKGNFVEETNKLLKNLDDKTEEKDVSLKDTMNNFFSGDMVRDMQESGEIKTARGTLLWLIWLPCVTAYSICVTVGGAFISVFTDIWNAIFTRKTEEKIEQELTEAKEQVSKIEASEKKATEKLDEVLKEKPVKLMPAWGATVIVFLIVIVAMVVMVDKVDRVVANKKVEVTNLSFLIADLKTDVTNTSAELEVKTAELEVKVEKLKNAGIVLTKEGARRVPTWWKPWSWHYNFEYFAKL